MPATRPIVIIGAGGHARDILDVFEAHRATSLDFEVLGFVVERAYFQPGSIVNGLPIMGDFDWLTERLGSVEVVCGVGEPRLRRRLTQLLLSHGARFASVVHPSSTLTRRVHLSEGTIVGAGVVMTSNVRVGAHAHVNIGCTLAHDVEIGDFAMIAPGAHLSGNVRIGTGTTVGTGATIIEKVSVGAWSIIGAGSSVIRDVPNDVTVVGCPGRIVKTRKAGWHLD